MRQFCYTSGLTESAAPFEPELFQIDGKRSRPTQRRPSLSPRSSARRNFALMSWWAFSPSSACRPQAITSRCGRSSLRIAVGPPNSDDLKVVQALSQAFLTSHGQIRLRPIQTDGATTSAQMIADGTGRPRVIRGDLSVPKNAQAVATVRKNVAVLWVPARHERQKARCENHQDFAAGRTPHRRRRPHAGQRRSAQGDPATIWRGPEQGRGRPVSNQRCG